MLSLGSSAVAATGTSMARRNAELWLSNTSPGYCEVTGISTGDSSCSSGACDKTMGCKGTFNLALKKSATWLMAATRCLRMCSACERCNYVSLSLKFRDCSWFERCNMSGGLYTTQPGFRSGRVNRSAAGLPQRRRWKYMLEYERWKYLHSRARDEVDLRMAQLHEYASLNAYNLSSVQRFLQHGAIRRQIHHGIHLGPEGQRLNKSRFETHVANIYQRHHRQTVATRKRLMRRWTSAPLLGRVGVWDLLHLLHFTIDHTDAKLRYTSQFIHSLQVYQTVVADPMPEHDDAYRRDMRLAALVHDFGKLLTVFGERDEHVDCMNRIQDPLGPVKRRGLDGLEVQWNHDELGYRKLRRYLPPRVNDVLRYHSLREIKYLIVPKFVAAKPRNDLDAAERAVVTQEEVRALWARMDPSDVERARFVTHFSYFDAFSKYETEDIPVIDYDEVQQLLLSYFPGGVIEW